MGEWQLEDGLGFIDQSSEMGRQVAHHDWSATPLGPIEGWPPALRVAVGLLTRSGFAKCLCWGPEMIAIYNDAFRPILGRKGDCLGLPFPRIWAEAWHEIGPIADQALAGKATYIQDFPLNVSRGFGSDELAFFTFSYSPVVDEAGTIVGFMDTVIETTRRVTRERNAEIRNRELQHRMKNTYAVISAIVSHSFRQSEDPQEIRTKLVGRIQALSRAQEILALSRGAGDTLREVISYALAPVLTAGDPRVRISGPVVDLSESESFALALALHELSTNALKYGALSGEDGRVDIVWTEDNRRLVLSWRESGGPCPGQPHRTGFGTFLIRDALQDAFGGEVTLDYPVEGCVFTLISEMRSTRELEDGRPSSSNLTRLEPAGTPTISKGMSAKNARLVDLPLSNECAR